MATVGGLREYFSTNSTFPIYQPADATFQNRVGDLIYDPFSITEKTITDGLSAITDNPYKVNNRHLRDTLNVISRLRRDSEIFLVISPGRSGTRALWRALDSLEGIKAYHHIPGIISGTIITEMFVRMVTKTYSTGSNGYYSHGTLGYYIGIYLRNRIVEIFQTLGRNKVVFVNHWESWWAPILETMFKRSKFLFLDRNPVDVVYFIASSTSVADRKTVDFLDETPEPDGRPSSNLFPVFVYRCKKTSELFGDVVEMSHLDSAIYAVEKVRNFGNALRVVFGDDRFLTVDMERMFNQNLGEIKTW